MSKEPKRVLLTTISSSQQTTTTNSANIANTNTETSSGIAPAFSSRFGGDFLAPEAPAAAATKSNAEKETQCIRLNLELFQTDSNKYPEFNFAKLLQLEKKKAKKLKTKTYNGPNDDPFADNDDDVARIAKELEKKYGNAYASGRGRKKKDDFCDIGMGYDESDSFIDNTEAYDEVIPEEVETIEGGFYINCGALEFKNLTKKSGTTRTDEIIKMPEKTRKRVLSSNTEDSTSSDEDDEEDDDDSEDDNESESESCEDDENGDTMNSKSNSNSKKYKHDGKRLKPCDATKQTTANNNSVNSDNNNSKKKSKKLIISSSSSNSPRPSAMETSDTDERQSAQAQALKKVVKTTTIKDMLKAKRDNFLKSQGDSASKGMINGEVKCTSTDGDSSSNNDSATEMDTRPDKLGKSKDNTDNLRSADTILPASLDPEIMGSVNTFKDMVRSRDMCGKKFYFDDKVTALLLKVYEALLCTERNERNMVFAHLEYQLQLPKYFILRKSKALRSKEEKNKSSLALEKLRRAVAESMPKALANYEAELHKSLAMQTADLNAEHPPKMPRKKFLWTQELRNLLYDVYQARWTSYAVLGKRKDSLMDFINGYLKEKVVDLWPTGWMRHEELQREIEKCKNSMKKVKEKKKVSASMTTGATTATSSTFTANGGSQTQSMGSNYIKQFEEFAGPSPSRSQGNSDTDSVTSASSNSLKRKLKDLPTTTTISTTSTKPNKPAKKRAPKQHHHQQQQQQQQQHNIHTSSTMHQMLPQHSDTAGLMSSMPSTSAQAAALTQAAAAAGVLDLVSPTKKTDHSIYNLITAATLAAAQTTGTSINTNTSQQNLNLLHSKLGNQQQQQQQRPISHVITLDDYKNPSDILQTSKQLAANTNYNATTTATTPIPTTTTNRNNEASANWSPGSSESDGVEIVGVYPASTATATTTPTAASKASPQILPVLSTTTNKPKGKTKNTTTSMMTANAAASTQNLPNGSLGIYLGNNNKSGKSSVTPTNAPPVHQNAFDFSNNQHIMKTLADLKALEKQIKWVPYPLSPNNMVPNGGSGTGSGAGAAGGGTAPNQ